MCRAKIKEQRRGQNHGPNKENEQEKQKRELRNEENRVDN